MRQILKTIPVLATLATPFAAAAAQPASSYAAEHLMPSALRIEINGLKFVCPSTDKEDTQSDCVYSKTRQHIVWMGMGNCPVQYEAKAISDVFMGLINKEPTDAELVNAYAVLKSIYSDMQTSCSVTGFTVN